MPIYVYIASAGVVASLFLFRWVVSGGERTSQAVRAALGVRVLSNSAVDVSRSQRVSRMLDRVPLLSSQASLSHRIATAGLHWRAGTVQMVKVGAVFGALLLSLTLWAAGVAWVVPLLVLLIGLASTLAPDAIIANKAETRQQLLETELPDLLDRLTISIEAGLGFDSALAHVVVDKEGPCHDEFRRVLQDLQLGVPRDIALASLAARTTVPDLRLVVASVIQSGAYGLPLANVLRVQTTELREKRWARAQEKALKIPVKVLLPMIFCILPSLFAVLIGPAILRLIRAL